MGWKAVEGLGEWRILAAVAKADEQLEGKSLARRTSCSPTAAQEHRHWLEAEKASWKLRAVTGRPL